LCLILLSIASTIDVERDKSVLRRWNVLDASNLNTVVLSLVIRESDSTMLESSFAAYPTHAFGTATDAAVASKITPYQP
jgi:hypothetical protein